MDIYEKELLADFQKGKRDAFEIVMDRYGKKVYNIIARMISDKEEAKDLTQETFIKVYKNMKNFKGESELYTWLYRIAVNCARDYWRRKVENYPISILENKISSEDSTEKTVIKDENLKNILAEIDELDLEYREVVILRDVLGYAYSEIAAILSLPVGTVKSRISRGRSKLRSRIDFKD
ncbi:RNA polymerase sigma factor [Alkalibacter mobilis]|uniref:RNA polymerase sigma factor n=1 Tax=Alkalibacter mobilis TaxID=2787712 RepID=UPI00189EA807|nr:sigma-70 family RNA polymerase sigma factor [Alkalibacter mobilis]MBF7096534.1 sigma-70 family RNA polymerase sigma factor [Alkalibacter mobilis]